jgi:hypothetical protein
MIRVVRRTCAALLLAATMQGVNAAELAGIEVPDSITLKDGSTLQLNGMGLREKLWIDVYVGSLYLEKRADNVAAALAQTGAYRVQMDFVYKEVSSEKLVEAWREGFNRNQSESRLKQMAERIERFYQMFDQNVVAGDRYTIDYLPETGTTISKNGTQLGLIEGEDFKEALLEIWVGNYPADQQLKRGMLGQD